MNTTFGATSTTDQVLEHVKLSGKRVLVTGVSAGLGVETARALASHGAEVVGAARDLAKAEKATEQVRAQASAGGSLQLVQLDLASLASVRRCADGINASQPQGAPAFSWKTIPQGAATSVWAACVADAGAVGGHYCEDCHVAEISTTPGIRGGVQPYALDPKRAQALWETSEQLVGERFSIN